MVAYEFSTKLTAGGHLVVPQHYTDEIPVGASLRVILLVDEPGLVTLNGDTPAEYLSMLEALVAKIQSKPSDPANIKPGNMQQLAAHLASAITEPEPSFDLAQWEAEWDRLEAEMEADSLTHEQEELKDFAP